MALCRYLLYVHLFTVQLLPDSSLVQVYVNMVDTSEPLKRKADILLTRSSAFSDKLIHSRNTYLLSCYAQLHLITLQQHETTSTHVIISVTSFTWTHIHCTYTTQYWYNIYEEEAKFKFGRLNLHNYK
jgi:hypothetical protein